MLDADGAVGSQVVEKRSVEVTGNGLVVADSANPSASLRAKAQGIPQRLDASDLRRAAADRCLGGGHGHQVDVVVVQAGEERAAGGVEHPLAAAAGQRAADLGDPAAGDAEVERRVAVDLCAGDQHEMESSSSTRSVSAPSGPRRAPDRPRPGRRDGGSLVTGHDLPAGAGAMNAGRGWRGSEGENVRDHIAEREVQQVSTTALPAGERCQGSVDAGKGIGDGIPTEERRAASPAGGGCEPGSDAGVVAEGDPARPWLSASVPGQAHPGESRGALHQ